MADAHPAADWGTAGTVWSRCHSKGLSSIPIINKLLMSLFSAQTGRNKDVGVASSSQGNTVHVSPCTCALHFRIVPDIVLLWVKTAIVRIFPVHCAPAFTLVLPGPHYHAYSPLLTALIVNMINRSIERHKRHHVGLQPAASAVVKPFRRLWRTSQRSSHHRGLVRFMTTSVDDQELVAERAVSPVPVQTMKQKLMSTASFRQFQNAIQRSVSLLRRSTYATRL